MEKILLVDDEKPSLLIMKGFLEDDFDISEAANGKEALAKSEEWKPDLMLLDILMPDMSGLEVCREIKGNSRYPDISIIIVTSKMEDSSLKEGLEAGAVDYIKKPFTGTELHARVKSALSLRHSLQSLKAANQEKEQVIARLEQALGEVKTLSGLLPICSNCKKIRNDEGYWKLVEEYFEEHSEVTFTHGICDECAEKLYPDHFIKEKKE